MLFEYLGSKPWQKLNDYLLTLVSVEWAPRKAVQSFSGFAVQRYMLCTTLEKVEWFCLFLILVDRRFPKKFALSFVVKKVEGV